MQRPVVLLTDFRDYYDMMFTIYHQEPPVGQPYLNRMMRGGLSRLEQFKLMERHQIPVIPYGYCRVLGLQHRGCWTVLGKLEYSQRAWALQLPARLVVYLDEDAHAGEGKIILSPDDALMQYPNALCSIWYPSKNLRGGVSFRHLQIGKRSWLLRYESPDDWRSNADSDVQVVRENQEGYHSLSPDYPLFAIDYAPSDPDDFDQGGYAIDFNSAPGVRWTGIPDILSASDVYQLISSAMEWGMEARNGQRIEPEASDGAP